MSKINYTGIEEQDKLIPMFRVIITTSPVTIIKKFYGYKKANIKGYNKATTKTKREKSRNKNEVYTFRDLG